MNNYRAAASRSPGLKDSLRKWASSQPAGNKINNYRVSRPKAPAKIRKIKKIKEKQNPRGQRGDKINNYRAGGADRGK